MLTLRVHCVAGTVRCVTQTRHVLMTAVWISTAQSEVIDYAMVKSLHLSLVE